MPIAAPPRTTRRLALVLSVILAAAGLLTLAPPSAQADPAGWGQFAITQPSSRNYAGTMNQQADGFPAATFVSNSVGGGVGVQSGTSTWLSAATEVGAKYGSSKNQGYLNLRPYNQNGAPPSVTTYTFDRPTPTSGWTFVLGDVDADQVTISATGPDGRSVAPSDLGFRSVFNYCTSGVCPASTDVPSWDPSTGVLLGNAGALDTNGASAWFEPTVPLTSLTFTFAQRVGFPVYQTWFSALEYNLTGTVTAPAGEQDGIRVLLFDPAGNQVGDVVTNEDGEYSFPGFATYDGYRVQVVRPTGLTSDSPLTQVVDLSGGDQVADFTLRAIVPVPVGGTVTDTDGNPIAGVTITLTDPEGGGDPRTAVTENDGSYVFDDVPVGAGYTLTATPPDGASVDGPLTFTVPPNSEVPITGQDFEVTLPVPPATGSLTGTVTREGDGPLGGVGVLVTGPNGTSFSTVSGADGSWSVAGLPPGDYTATVQPPAGTSVVGEASVDATIPADGGEVDDLDFVLTVTPIEQEPQTAGGTVTDTAGDPVPGVEIEVTDPVDGSTDTVTTDEDGAWSIEGLAPAEGYTAEVVSVPDGFESPEDSTLSFDVVDDPVTGLDFEVIPEVAPTPTPTPTPTPSPTTASPSPDPTVTETIEVDSGSGSSSGSSGSSSSGSLASTGGPSLLIGLGGVALLLAGVLTLAARRRGRRS